MSRASARRRLARLESAIVPAAQLAFSDEDLIAALGTRSTGPSPGARTVRDLQKLLGCSIMMLAHAFRLERAKPKPWDRIACGPVELTGEVELTGRC